MSPGATTTEVDVPGIASTATDAALAAERDRVRRSVGHQELLFDDDLPVLPADTG